MREQNPKRDLIWWHRSITQAAWEPGAEGSQGQGHLVELRNLVRPHFNLKANEN